MNAFLNQIFGISTAFAQPFTSAASSASDKSTNLAAETGNQVQNLVTQVFQAIPLWITGFLVIALSLLIAKIVKSTVENKMTEAGLEEEHREVQIVAGRASSAAVLLIGITAGLKIAGLDLTPIIAAAAFGVGFAMQDIIMNFFSGIIVLLQKQYTIGDWIKVNGTYGIIKQIQSRYTVIKKFDGTNVIVPNAELFKHQVNTFTSNPERRFSLNLHVDLYMDLKEVIDTLYKSVAKCDKILKKPRTKIIVQQPGPYYNSLQIRAWVVSKKGILQPISALMRQIHKDFYRKGWAFPYQVNQIYFDQDAPKNVSERAKNYVDTHKRKKKVAPAPAPVSSSVGLIGPETPAWLKQAAAATAGQAEQTAPSAPASNEVVVQSIQVDPVVKNVTSSQAEPAPTPVSAPIVVAPLVEPAHVEQPAVAMPLPDVQK